MNTGMLRISEPAISNGAATVFLEGRVIGPWVAELERVCERVLRENRELTLDLAGIQFVDRRGAGMLRSLAGRNARLINCPLFVIEQLKSQS